MPTMRVLTMSTLLLAACAAPEPSCAPPTRAMPVIEIAFGRAIPGGGEVSDAAWTDFVREVVAPSFPDGSTTLDASGAWRGADGRMLAERTKLLILAVPDRAAAAPKVDAAIAEYKRRFRQESVLRMERTACVAFQ